MPLPTTEGKDQNTFMGECIPAVLQEGKSQDEAVAICQGKWNDPQKVDQLEKPEKPKKGKLELLNDFKKQLEKNGISITEDKLLELFSSMTAKQNTLSLSSDPIKLESSILEDHTTQEIKIFPRGKVWINKYKVQLTFDELFFNTMIDNFNDSKLFKPYVDENHDLGIKYADIVELSKKDDGLYAKIQLNEMGLDVIKNNKYSYISPEWGDRVDTEKKLHKNVLFAVTLTNVPALEGELPKLQEQIKLTKERGKTMTLDQRVLAAQTKLSIKLEGESADMVPMASVQEIADLLTELKAKVDELTIAKDNAEEVAEEMAGELNQIKEAEALSIKESFFKEKVSLGQLEPCEVEDYKELYKTNESLVRKILDGRQAKDESKTLSGEVVENTVKLSIEDSKIMESCGMDPSDPKQVKEYLKINSEVI